MSNKPLKIFLFCCLVFIFLFFPSNVSAQVINEFLPKPNVGEIEWVEFYNNSLSTIDLSDFYFDDDTSFDSHIGKTKILLSGLLIAGSASYRQLDASGYLNDTGDSPTLFRTDGSTVDTYTYTSVTEGKSYGRVPDGGEWQTEQIPTKSSTQCSDLAPSPTPSPTPTPTPTPIPTPTPTPTKTLTPTPTKTPTPKPSPKPRPSEGPSIGLAESEESKTGILGLREGLAEPSPSPVVGEGSKKKFPILPILLIVGGIGCMGAAGYVVFNNMEKLLDELENLI